MKVVVTGGSGQLGSLVLRRLIDDPAVSSIVSIDLRPPLFVSEKLHAVECDVRDPKIGEHFAHADALLHFAFVVVKHMPPEEAHAINVGGSKNVFEAAARAGVRRIVYSSSIAAYGVLPGHPNPLTETSTRVHQANFVYAATKFEVEDLLDTFERSYPEISIARLRPSILVGKSMDHALGNLLRRGFLPDTGDDPFPIVWDEDVADAAILAVEQAAHGAFNLSSEGSHTAREIAEASGLHVLRSTAQARRAMAQAIGQLARWGIWSGIDPAWLSATAPLYVSSERAKLELGWSPRCSTGIAVMKHHLDTVPRRLDPRIGLFFTVLRLLSKTRRLTLPHSRVRLVLTGKGGGELGLYTENGKLDVRGAPPRPPTSVVTMPAALLRDLLTGRLAIDAVSNDDMMRVEGDSSARNLMSTIVRAFRDGEKEKGPRRMVTQVFSRFLQGATA